MPDSVLSTLNYTLSFNPHSIPVRKTTTVFSILKMKKPRLRESKRLILVYTVREHKLAGCPNAGTKRICHSLSHIYRIWIKPGLGTQRGVAATILGLNVTLVRIYLFINLFISYLLIIYYRKDSNFTLGI